MDATTKETHAGPLESGEKITFPHPQEVIDPGAGTGTSEEGKR
jgi:hypothetical protein